MCCANDLHTSAYVSIHQHTSAYVIIRQHKSSYISIRQLTSAYVSLRQHTSAYVIIRQHTSAYVGICQHTSAYVSIRHHTSAYVSIRQHTIHQHTELRERPRGHFTRVREPLLLRCNRAQIGLFRLDRIRALLALHASCVSTCTFVPVKQVK